MQFPIDFKYSKEHTWVKIEDETGIIGITEFAQSELGEIVYVDLPNIGKTYSKDEVFGSVEAVKTTSDLFMPVSGEILEINTALQSNPSLINLESFTNGWMIKIKLSQPSQINILLDAEAYENLVN